MRLTQEQFEHQKKLILESAFYIFSKKGYTATTISDIAEHANTSRSPIYYHFHDKANLFNIVFQNCCMEISDMTESIFRQDRDIFSKFTDELEELLTPRFRAMEQLKWDTLSGIPELVTASNYFDMHKQRILKLKTEAVKNAQASGELKADFDPLVLVLTMFVFYNGLCSPASGWMKIVSSSNIGTSDDIIHSFISGQKSRYARVL